MTPDLERGINIEAFLERGVVLQTHGCLEISAPNLAHKDFTENKHNYCSILHEPVGQTTFLKRRFET